MRANNVITPWLLLVLLASCVMLSACMEHDKFQKCNDKSFCKRLREQKKTNYKVISTEVVDAKGLLKGVVENSNQVDSALAFSVQAYENGIFRFRLEDFVRKRFVVQDVIVASAKTAPFTSTSAADSITLISGAGKLVITFSKFTAKFYHGETLLITMNADDLFRQEQLKSQQQQQQQQQQGEGTTTTPEGEATTEAEATPAAAPPAEVEVQEGALAADFLFHGASNLFGIPERATSLSLKSTRNENGEILSEPYRIFNLDVFEYELDNPIGLYGIVPLLLGITSNSGMSGAIFWLNPSESFVDLTTKSTEMAKSAHWVSESGLIDVFFLPGPYAKDITRQYHFLTGKPFMPQYFSTAYHQCRWNYKDEEDVRNVDAKFDEFDIPYDVLWLDIEHTDSKMYFTWDKNNFPTPTDMLANIASKGRKMVTISDPHIKRQSGYFVHEEATSKGFYIKKSDGSTDFEGWCWPGSSSWLDLFNPDVRAWYSSLFSFEKYLGAAENLYTWIDMNEPSVFNGPEITLPKDSLHLDGTPHGEIHNMYGFYQGMAAYDGQMMRRNGQDRPFVLSRSFFAGSQRYVAIWTGDNMANWDHLQKSVPMLLALSISGIPFVGADVGGFFLNPSEELLVRWYQFGAFYPFFRAHAHLETKRREPWLFSTSTTRAIQLAVERRYSLLPYWYTLWFAAHTSGDGAVVRPMFFEYPADPATHALDDQYLVGTDLLVKPVTQSGATSISVYLPINSGVWYDYDSGARYESADYGNNGVELKAPADHLPVLQRGGSIIPKKDRIRRSSAQAVNDPFSLAVALDSSLRAFGQLYIDDGKTFNYRTNGDFILRNFAFTPSVFSTYSFVLTNRKAAAVNNNNATTATATTKIEFTTSASTSPVFTTNSNNKYKISNTIEKIVISGFPRKPIRVYIENNNNNNNNSEQHATMMNDEEAVVVQSVVFDYENGNGEQRLVLRKPEVLVADDWDIVIVTN